jgi:ribonuclease J
VRVRIHRGAHEIGGNCIEVEADGTRLVLDVGRPLSAGWDEDVELPAVAGFVEPDASLLAVIVSHPHLDHYGLVGGVSVDVPIYIGEEAARVLDAAAFFSPISASVKATGWLRDRESFRLGPFELTPSLNDHSAFDAYSLLIEAEGRRLFYTGDFRGHGRKAALFERLLAHPPTPVHALLMEGTHVRSTPGEHDDDQFETETELEQRLVELCEAVEGAVTMFGSAQNLDRVVTAFRAARRTGRELVVDLYGATVAAATRTTIPQPGFDGLRVYVPHAQRVKVKRAGEFHRTEGIQACRVFPEELAANPERFLFHVPSSTARELVNAGVLDSRGVAAWSLWPGYLRQPSGERLLALLADAGIELRHLHTSGHASVPDLRRLVDALNPDALVPIHSEATDRFASLFPRVVQHADGMWWEV